MWMFTDRHNAATPDSLSRGFGPRTERAAKTQRRLFDALAGGMFREYIDGDRELACRAIAEVLVGEA